MLQLFLFVAEHRRKTDEGNSKAVFTTALVHYFDHFSHSGLLIIWSALIIYLPISALVLTRNNAFYKISICHNFLDINC